MDVSENVMMEIFITLFLYSLSHDLFDFRHLIGPESPFTTYHYIIILTVNNCESSCPAVKRIRGGKWYKISQDGFNNLGLELWDKIEQNDIRMARFWVQDEKCVA